MTTSKTVAIWILGFVAIIIIAIVSYISLRPRSALNDLTLGELAHTTINGGSSVLYPIAPVGKWYFSLGVPNDGAPSGISAYDIGTAAWTKLPASKDSTLPTYSNISPSVSHDMQHIAFSRKEAGRNEPRQLYMSSITGESVTSITSSSIVSKTDLSWSPDDAMIAYAGQNVTPTSTKGYELLETWRTYLDSLKGIDYQVAIAKMPETWSVYVTDLKGKEYKIANGINPIFSPSGKQLLILKGDGLHLFDIRDPAKPKDSGTVFPIIRASKSIKVSLSPDGTALAWTYAGVTDALSKTDVYRINSWEHFSLSLYMTTTGARSYWSVFSPDSRYLAIEQSFTDENAKTYPVVRVYDLSTGYSRDIVPLKDYTKENVWFGGWTK